MWSRDIASNFKTGPGKKYCLSSEIGGLQDKNPWIFMIFHQIPYVNYNGNSIGIWENPRIFILQTTYLRAQTIFFAWTCFKIRGYVSTSHSARFLVSGTRCDRTASKTFLNPPPWDGFSNNRLHIMVFSSEFWKSPKKVYIVVLQIFAPAAG